MSTNKQLQAAGYSIASNIFVQVFSRSLTFIVRSITLKYLQSSALLGIINVRLALLYTTLQFLSREPFRRACIGELAKTERKKWSKIVNTIWLGLILSIMLAIPLTYIWKNNSPPKEDLVGTTIQDYHLAVLLVCLSAIVEMLAEPCYIYAQAKALSDHNPKVEIVSFTLKCFLTALVTVLESNSYKTGQSSSILMKVSACQLFSSVIHVLYSYARLCYVLKLSPMKFLPNLHRSPRQDNDDQDREKLIYRYLDQSSLKLSAGFMSQTFLKQFLTEGERYIMTFFNVISLSDQGIYDVINNLGSLSARLLFKPIEDSAYTLFSQTVSRTELLDIRKFYKVQENLMFLIQSMLLIGLIIMTFGYNFVPLIVLYGGEKLNNPTTFNLFRWQLLYTPLLAVNGVTECFTFAAMSTTQIRQFNLKLIYFSIVFVVSVYLTRPLFGSACFIFSNCVIMLLRILSSFKLIKGYFNKHGYELDLRNASPSLTTFISGAGVFVFLSLCRVYLLDMTQPLSIIFSIILGGWSLLFIIHVIVSHEENLLNFASRLFKLKD